MDKANLVQAKNIGIIGSGVAGLASAIRLAIKGYEVTVYEKNSYPGGKLSQFTLEGFHFDAGPSLFTQPNNIVELFTLSGKNINDYLRYSSVSISCRYFFENGVVVDGYANKDLFAEELNVKIGEPKEKFLKYINAAEQSYINVGNKFLNNSLHKKETWLNRDTLSALKSTKWAYLFSTLNNYNQSFFDKEETIQIFNRFATYNGSNPYSAPAMLSMIPHLEINEGTYYPEGGMINITNALYLLAIDIGVQFKFNHTVTKIDILDGSVNGIHCDGVYYKHDIVVSNSDIYYTYKYLLNDQKSAQSLLKQERSSSAIIFYWGIKHSFHNLQLHNIFFSKNYKQEFAHIFEKKTLYDDPTVYINITSKIDKHHAPDGCENWFVMVNAPHDKGQDWQKMRIQCRHNIIVKLNKLLNTNIEELIGVEDFLDPVLIDRRTLSYTGSLYGTSSNSKLAAFLRHPNWSQKHKNLYFVGGSVHPGGGIPLCLKSASITTDIIHKNISK